MKNTCIFIVAITVLLSLNACRKIAMAKKMLSNAEVVSHFGYRVNSYWIYSDGVSGSTDSFVIAGCKNRLHANGIPDGSDIDDLSFVIVDHNKTLHASDTFNWRLSLSVDNVALFIDDPKTNNQGYSGEIFCYPFKQGFMEMLGGSSGSSFSKITNVFSSYVVNGVSYSNVAEINLYTGSNLPGIMYTRNDFIYVCADAGVIKMNIDHPTEGLRKDWQLLRCHLEL